MNKAIRAAVCLLVFTFAMPGHPATALGTAIGADGQIAIRDKTFDCISTLQALAALSAPPPDAKPEVAK